MNILNSFIKLDKLRFHAFHGVLPQERCVGTHFILSLRIGTDYARALVNDSLDCTLNYAEVYAAIKEEMDIPSQLLEHVAGRILQRLYRDFPSIRSIDILLEKENPPMGGQCQSTGVELQTRR